MSGRFLRERPIEVRIDGVGNQSAINIFRNLVQAQAQDVCITREDIYAFGWYEKHFHWLDPNAVDMSQGEEYGVAVRMAELLANGNRVVTALALASVHGPLKHVLQLAGIQHDFITFIVGESSVGKTSVARILCSYHEDRSNVLALSSDRKGLKKVLQGMRDTTVVIDDFAQSSSDRVVSNQLQTISEIIQTSSDAGNVILDETSFGMSNRVHLVATGEKIIRNPSTMNRCFLVNFTEPLQADCWNDITYMERDQIFRRFIKAFIRYVEKRFDDVVQCCKTDFPTYKQLVKDKCAEGSHGINRIAETLGVQYTVKKLLLDYLRAIGLDEKLLGRVDHSINNCIDVCGQDLQQKLNEMCAEEKYMTLLPTLASIFASEGNGYELAEDEKAYQKAKKKRKNVIGFHQNRGYVSFDPAYMSVLLARELDKDAVSVSCLGKELSHYHLAHVDGSECKQSCRWHTEGKYYHVSFRQLLELTNVMDDVEEMVDVIEGIIEDFEDSYE